MEQDLSKLSIDRTVRETPGSGRRIIIGASVVVVVIVIIALVIAFARRAPEVTVASVRSAAGSGQSSVLNASGYVTPQRRATVSAKTTGKIKEVLIDEGMHVKSGQVLARLDDIDAVATLRAAEAERAVATASLKEIEVRLDNARRTLERNRDLRTHELVSQQALDDAETGVASLDAQLVVARETVGAAERSVDITRQNVDNCVIRAPFEGIIVSKDAQPGEMVSPISAGGGFTRTGIATVVDMNSLEVEVDVNESYIARVKQGQPVETVLDAYPDWRIPSKVRTVIPTADRQKATVKVRITFDQLDPRILPDMGVKVLFLEGAPDSSAFGLVLVPKDAIRRDGEKSYVFLVKDGRVERRAVRTSGERGTDVAVIAGLRQGEMVVVSAADMLHDGEKVSLRK